MYKRPTNWPALRFRALDYLWKLFRGLLIDFRHLGNNFGAGQLPPYLRHTRTTRARKQLEWFTEYTVHREQKLYQLKGKEKKHKRIDYLLKCDKSQLECSLWIAVLNVFCWTNLIVSHVSWDFQWIFSHLPERSS